MPDYHLWYKTAIFYEVNIRSFYDSNNDGIGDIQGLTEKIPYFVELGIDCLWLMPFYPSPLNDDGYDISDYYNVHPDLGTLEDFKSLVDHAHNNGIRIITDLVLNHTSDQHHWFKKARKDPNSKYRDYYVWSNTDQKYKDARIIFLDTEDSNWTWDQEAGQFFWHRFYSSQPDLNFDNPAVQDEMLNVANFWLDLGVDGFRADAVPYLFEREGTNCENLPETHSYLKKLRQFMDDYYPGRILLCEANQWPADLLPYLKDEDEFHMGFHFPLMPRIFMSLRKGDVTDLKDIIDRTPEIPESTQWCTFLRNHDELTLEMVSEDDRQFLWEEYAPDPRMRLNLGIRRRLSPLLNKDQALIGLANSLLFTLPGSPIIYYGDEIGMGDNIWLEDRNGVRTPMQWSNNINAGFSNAVPDNLYQPIIDSPEYPVEYINVESQKAEPGSLFKTIKNLVAVRKNSMALMQGSFAWENSMDNKHIAAYYRIYKEEIILSINNLSSSKQTVSLDLANNDVDSIRNLINQQYYKLEAGQLRLDLHPYQYFWLAILDKDE